MFLACLKKRPEMLLSLLQDCFLTQEINGVRLRA
jgi:hypothetical protein